MYGDSTTAVVASGQTDSSEVHGLKVASGCAGFDRDQALSLPSIRRCPIWLKIEPVGLKNLGPSVLLGSGMII
jgi:hypothetical protein